MPIKPEILKRETVMRSRLFRVDEVHLRFSNGNERVYEKLCSGGPGAVLIVPLLNNSTVLMVREYAAGLDDYHLACAKGAVDAGETVM
ncbi:MAG: ADP compounds hydrolase NudE, partial [Moraxellaceae bacterium]